MTDRPPARLTDFNRGDRVRVLAGGTGGVVVVGHRLVHVQLDDGRVAAFEPAELTAAVDQPAKPAVLRPRRRS
jgi:hypothetical protein